MKHKKFDIQILREIKILYRYDNWHAVIALLLDYLVITIAIYLSECSFAFLPISILLIGSRQRALATILHEASHSALTKNKKLGKILGTYCSGYLIFQSWNSYYLSHVKQHHPKLGSEIDPDYLYYKESKIFEKHSKLAFFYHFLISHFLFLKTLSSLKYLIYNRLLKTNFFELLKIIVMHLTLALTLSYCIGWYAYFLYWLLPYITTFQMITWFIELAEHYPMIASAEQNIMASRNRFSHPIEHFFTGMHSENYHLIHHLFPAIPFWNLKKAHKILLQDKDYSEINSTFGGIFLSNRGYSSMWINLWKNYGK